MAAKDGPMNLGRALQDEIAKRGIYHREAAEIIGVRQQSFTKWANNQNFPSHEQLPAVARFLHLPVAQVRAMRAVSSTSTGVRLDKIEGEFTDLKDELKDIRKTMMKVLARLPDPDA